MTKKIIEITSLKELIEISGVAGIQGTVMNPAHFANKGKDFRKEQQMRKDMQTEMLMREYVRNKIKKEIWEEKRREEEAEHKLRLVIRSLIKEAKEMANPHPNTGINKLRDAFRKAKPTLKAKYQQLTSTPEQRQTFTSHMLRAFVRLFDELDALQAQGDVDSEIEGIKEPEEAPAPTGLEAPPEDQGSEEIEAELEDLLEAILNEVQVELEEKEIDIVSDEEQKEEEKRKSQAEKDFQKKKEAEAEKAEFGDGLAGDATGRNQAFDTFRLVQSYFSDAYLDLSNEEDQKMYRDWCLYNLKLLFKNFEESLPTAPTSPEISDPEGV